MTVTAVVGLQWGDEAKGKTVDMLSTEADVVARFNGGDNAGHTVVNEYGTFKLRLTPNGFSNPKTQCIIGPGVVVNPETLIDEINSIQSRGLDLSDRLWVSPRCHVIMPYHPMLEAIYEQAKGAEKTGTTGRGIGPVYADKVSYNGIRLADLADPERFRRRLEIQLNIKNPILSAFGMQTLDLEEVFNEKREQFRRLQPYVREPFGYLQEALTQGKNIVLEGAQGALLDTDWGTYPFTTASTTLAGGAADGLGIAPRWISRVVGVTKAYTTRVGGGPMPTELHDEVGETLAREGQEFGTVTGRPRRCGWFDADLVRFTAALNGATEITLTKLDVLDTLPTIQIGIGYRRPQEESEEAGNLVYHYWQGDAAWLEDCVPVTMQVEGWQQPTQDIREFDELPPAARAYIRKVEELVGVPVRTVSVGPEREAVIRVPSLD